MNDERPIVLASGSPRRRQLLEMLRIPFRVIAPDVDEHVFPGEPPDQYVTRLSRAKAEAVAAKAPGDLILAADTTVVLDGTIFEKPESPAHAVAMLFRLQGRTHEVMTAVAVLRDGDLGQALDVSRVTFRSVDEATLAAYVATGEPLDKAGAYAIQGLGAPLIERVEGDFFGVMGLPLRLALDLLARFGRPYRFHAIDRTRTPNIIVAPGPDARYIAAVRDRSTLRTRKRRLHDPEDHADVRGLTPDARVALVWQLTLQAWAFTQDDLEHEPRLRRDVVRVTRRGS